MEKYVIPSFQLAGHDYLRRGLVADAAQRAEWDRAARTIGEQMVAARPKIRLRASAGRLLMTCHMSDNHLGFMIGTDDDGASPNRHGFIVKADEFVTREMAGEQLVELIERQKICFADEAKALVAASQLMSYWFNLRPVTPPPQPQAVLPPKIGKPIRERTQDPRPDKRYATGSAIKPASEAVCQPVSQSPRRERTQQARPDDRQAARQARCAASAIACSRA